MPLKKYKEFLSIANGVNKGFARIYVLAYEIVNYTNNNIEWCPFFQDPSPVFSFFNNHSSSPSKIKISSIETSKYFSILSASSRLGLYLLFSIAVSVCLVTCKSSAIFN